MTNRARERGSRRTDDPAPCAKRQEGRREGSPALSRVSRHEGRPGIIMSAERGFIKINLDRGVDGMIKYLYLSEKAFFFCLFFGGHVR